MPIQATSSRRKLIVIALLCAALAGGALRHWADNPSLLRDMGSLLLVLWLPVIGSVLGWLGNRLPRPAPPPLAFEPGLPFSADLVIAFTPLVPDPKALAEPLDPEQHLFTLVVGRDGFRVRPPEAPASYLGLQAVPSLELQFLRPQQALRHFPVGTDFRVLWGSHGVGKGTVLSRPG